MKNLFDFKSLSAFYYVTTTLFFLLLLSCSKDEDMTSLPIVYTTEIFDITQNALRYVGKVESDGKILSKGICWSTSPNPSIDGNCVDNGLGIGQFIGTIKGLNDDTQYYVRVYATNDAGTAYGDVIDFKTSEIPIIQGDLEIKSQQVLDLLFKSGLVAVDGNLTIGGYNSNIDINSLESMNSLQEVTGDLEIFNLESLKSLEGLENLTTIGGSLIIFQNEELSNLDGLQKLNSVGLNIDIYYNNSLESIAGLNQLSSVEGYLEIYQNPNLKNLNGLDNIVSVFDYLTIYNNDKLNDITALNKLESIAEDFQIYNNDRLTNLDGISNLKTIGGSLKIQSNSSLANIKGLSGITSLGGSDKWWSSSLRISDNSSLVDLSGLENLTVINGDLYIDGNDVLNSLEALSNLTSVESLHIEENNKLTSLNGIENIRVTSDWYPINISYNYKLTNFCALKDVIEGLRLDDFYDYSVYENSFNPTKEDVLNGDCKK